jgi:hypothetical protein
MPEAAHAPRPATPKSPFQALLAGDEGESPAGITWRELGVVLAGLTALAAAVFGTHILHKGFYYDDWDNLARTRWPLPYHGYLGAIHATWDQFGYRPALAVYITTLYTVLDDHMVLHLAWISFLAVVMSTTLYALLRELAFTRAQSGILAALVLVFPLSDSTRLWTTAGTGSLTTALFLAGALLSLRAFREADDRRRLRLHVAGAAFYLVSMLFAEVATFAIPAMFFLYLVRAGWRRALIRSAIDTIVVFGPAYYIASNSKIPQAKSDLHTRLERIRTIFDQGMSAASYSLLPQLGWPRAVAIWLGVITLAAACVYLWRGPDAVVRRRLRRWVLALPAGFAILAAGYAIYIPADPYYVPLQPGVGNRVNVLPAIGLVLLAATVVMLAATLIGAAIPRERRGIATAVLGGVVLLAIGGGYIDRARADAAAFDRAFTVEQNVLGIARLKLPPPPRGSVIYEVGAPNFEAAGVPIFAASWDFHGAIDYVYGDRTLVGYPALPGVGFICGPSSMYPVGGGYGPGNGAPYGIAYVLNVTRGTAVRIRDHATCLAQAKLVVPGPFQAEP